MTARNAETNTKNVRKKLVWVDDIGNTHIKTHRAGQHVSAHPVPSPSPDSPHENEAFDELDLVGNEHLTIGFKPDDYDGPDTIWDDDTTSSTANPDVDQAVIPVHVTKLRSSLINVGPNFSHLRFPTRPWYQKSEWIYLGEFAGGELWVPIVPRVQSPRLIGEACSKFRIPFSSGAPMSMFRGRAKIPGINLAQILERLGVHVLLWITAGMKMDICHLKHVLETVHVGMYTEIPTHNMHSIFDFGVESRFEFGDLEPKSPALYRLCLNKSNPIHAILKDHFKCEEHPMFGGQFGGIRLLRKSFNNNFKSDVERVFGVDSEATKLCERLYNVTKVTVYFKVKDALKSLGVLSKFQKIPKTMDALRRRSHVLRQILDHLFVKIKNAGDMYLKTRVEVTYVSQKGEGLPSDNFQVDVMHLKQLLGEGLVVHRFDVESWMQEAANSFSALVDNGLFGGRSTKEVSKRKLQLYAYAVNLFGIVEPRLQKYNNIKESPLHYEEVEDDDDPAFTPSARQIREFNLPISAADLGMKLDLAKRVASLAEIKSHHLILNKNGLYSLKHLRQDQAVLLCTQKHRRIEHKCHATEDIDDFVARGHDLMLSKQGALQHGQLRVSAMFACGDGFKIPSTEASATLPTTSSTIPASFSSSPKKTATTPTSSSSANTLSTRKMKRFKKDPSLDVTIERDPTSLHDERETNDYTFDEDDETNADMSDGTEYMTAAEDISDSES